MKVRDQGGAKVMAWVGIVDDRLPSQAVKTLPGRKRWTYRAQIEESQKIIVQTKPPII